MQYEEAYLDNAATMKPHPEAVEAVCAYMRDGFGNASASHARGARAREVLEASRQTVADALGVDPSCVYFTSGGTESNNLAIRGACLAIAQQRRGIAVSCIEHASVTKTVRGMKRDGWPVRYVGLTHGAFDAMRWEAVATDDIALFSCMSVQNEVGMRLDVQKIVEIRDRLAPCALVHTDGVQAFGKVPFAPAEIGVDLASISAHKIGGPQGIGALYVKQGTPMFTTAFGGGQERGLRSGTEPVALAAGFAAAARVTFSQIEETQLRCEQLKRQLVGGILELCPDARINSPEDGSPYIVSFSLPGWDNAQAISFLSERGVYVSKASACETLHADIPSSEWRKKHPLSLQMVGVPKELLDSTFRISFSSRTTQDDVSRCLAALRAYGESSLPR